MRLHGDRPSRHGSWHKRQVRQGLKNLFHDRTFVDYFNVFLNLPVFGQRALFKLHTKIFIFSPSVGAYIHNHRVLDWIHEQRFRIFTRTKLCHEYILCRKLLQAGLTFRFDSSDTKIKAQNLLPTFLTNLIGSVAGMYLFRQYLRGTNGARVIACWMHMQLLRKTRDPAKRVELFAALRRLYLRTVPVIKAEFQTWTEIVASDLLNFPVVPVMDEKLKARINKGGPIPAKELDPRSNETLQRLQEVLLAALQSYWLPCYVLHVMASQNLTILKELFKTSKDDKVDTAAIRGLVSRCTLVESTDDNSTLESHSLISVSSNIFTIHSSMSREQKMAGPKASFLQTLLPPLDSSASAVSEGSQERWADRQRVLWGNQDVLPPIQNYVRAPSLNDDITMRPWYPVYNVLPPVDTGSGSAYCSQSIATSAFITAHTDQSRTSDTWPPLLGNGSTTTSHSSAGPDEVSRSCSPMDDNTNKILNSSPAQGTSVYSSLSEMTTFNVDLVPHHGGALEIPLQPEDVESLECSSEQRARTQASRVSEPQSIGGVGGELSSVDVLLLAGLDMTSGKRISLSSLSSATSLSSRIPSSEDSLLHHIRDNRRSRSASSSSCSITSVSAQGQGYGNAQGSHNQDQGMDPEDCNRDAGENSSKGKSSTSADNNHSKKEDLLNYFNVKALDEYSVSTNYPDSSCLSPSFSWLSLSSEEEYSESDYDMTPSISQSTHHSHVQQSTWNVNEKPGAGCGQKRKAMSDPGIDYQRKAESDHKARHQREADSDPDPEWHSKLDDAASSLTSTEDNQYESTANTMSINSSGSAEMNNNYSQRQQQMNNNYSERDSKDASRDNNPTKTQSNSKTAKTFGELRSLFSESSSESLSDSIDMSEESAEFDDEEDVEKMSLKRQRKRRLAKEKEEMEQNMLAEKRMQFMREEFGMWKEEGPANITNLTKVALHDMALKHETVDQFDTLLIHFVFGARDLEVEDSKTDRRTLCLLSCDNFADCPLRKYIITREQLLNAAYLDLWTSLRRYVQLRSLCCAGDVSSCENRPQICRLLEQQAQHVSSLLRDTPEDSPETLDCPLVSPNLLLKPKLRRQLLEDVHRKRQTTTINAVMDVVANVLSIPATQYILHDLRAFHNIVLRSESPEPDSDELSVSASRTFECGLPLGRVPSGVAKLVDRRDKSQSLKTFEQRRCLSDPWADDPETQVNMAEDPEVKRIEDEYGVQIGVITEQHRVMAFRYLVLTSEDIYTSDLFDMSEFTEMIWSDFGSLHIETQPRVRNGFLRSLLPFQRLTQEQIEMLTWVTRTLMNVELEGVQDGTSTPGRKITLGANYDILQKMRKRRMAVDAPRPSQPKSFNEVLNEDYHYCFFRLYLISQGPGHIDALNFWKAVEEAKMTSEVEDRNHLFNIIKFKYLLSSRRENLLMDPDACLKAGMNYRGNPVQILQLQQQVRDELEKKWWLDFAISWPSLEELLDSRVGYDKQWVREIMIDGFGQESILMATEDWDENIQLLDLRNEMESDEDWDSENISETHLLSNRPSEQDVFTETSLGETASACLVSEAGSAIATSVAASELDSGSETATPDEPDEIQSSPKYRHSPEPSHSRKSPTSRKPPQSIKPHVSHKPLSIQKQHSSTKPSKSHTSAKFHLADKFPISALSSSAKTEPQLPSESPKPETKPAKIEPQLPSASPKSETKPAKIEPQLPSASPKPETKPALQIPAPEVHGSLSEAESPSSSLKEDDSRPVTASKTARTKKKQEKTSKGKPAPQTAASSLTSVLTKLGLEKVGFPSTSLDSTPPKSDATAAQSGAPSVKIESVAATSEEPEMPTAKLPARALLTPTVPDSQQDLAADERTVKKSTGRRTHMDRKGRAGAPFKKKTGRGFMDQMTEEAENALRKKRRRKIVVIWTRIAKVINAFTATVRDPIEMRLFEAFLRKELEMAQAKNQIPFNPEKPTYTRMASTSMLIVINKLPADLRFWVEVDRFRRQVLEVQALKEDYAEEWESMQDFLSLRANAIINCFLNSVTPPTVQVNLSDQDAFRITATFTRHGACPSLFHIAIMRITPLLIFYWKQFQFETRERGKSKTPAQTNLCFLGNLPHPHEGTPDYSKSTVLDYKPIYVDIDDHQMRGMPKHHHIGPRKFSIMSIKGAEDEESPTREFETVTAVEGLTSHQPQPDGRIKFSLVNGIHVVMPVTEELRRQRREEKKAQEKAKLKESKSQKDKDDKEGVVKEKPKTPKDGKKEEMTTKKEKKEKGMEEKKDDKKKSEEDKKKAGGKEDKGGKKEEEVKDKDSKLKDTKVKELKEKETKEKKVSVIDQAKEDICKKDKKAKAKDSETDVKREKTSEEKKKAETKLLPFWETDLDQMLEPVMKTELSQFLFHTYDPRYPAMIELEKAFKEPSPVNPLRRRIPHHDSDSFVLVIEEAQDKRQQQQKQKHSRTKSTVSAKEKLPKGEPLPVFAAIRLNEPKGKEKIQAQKMRDAKHKAMKLKEKGKEARKVQKKELVKKPSIFKDVEQKKMNKYVLKRKEFIKQESRRKQTTSSIPEAAGRTFLRGAAHKAVGLGASGKSHLFGAAGKLVGPGASRKYDLLGAAGKAVGPGASHRTMAPGAAGKSVGPRASHRTMAPGAAGKSVGPRASHRTTALRPSDHPESEHSRSHAGSTALIPGITGTGGKASELHLAALPQALSEMGLESSIALGHMETAHHLRKLAKHVEQHHVKLEKIMGPDALRMFLRPLQGTVQATWNMQEEGVAHHVTSLVDEILHARLQMEMIVAAQEEIELEERGGLEGSTVDREVDWMRLVRENTRTCLRRISSLEGPVTFVLPTHTERLSARTRRTAFDGGQEPIVRVTTPEIVETQRTGRPRRKKMHVRQLQSGLD